MVGRTVLQYQLTERIGGDGMGVVWKALDTRLGREVALKFLPESSSSDSSQRERFLREARAASALNHPNIVTIYEIDSDAGQLFIAMELVKGRTLADVLEGKSLSSDIAIDYAIQLCDGLGSAHRAGMIHRDIKPSNVMVTQDGMIKILDFGLAKSYQTESHSAIPADRPLTESGSIIGTIPYMSPEQVVGGQVDARSDVFSVGIVLYEMLSGRRPFQGSSNSDILRALLSENPTPLLSLVPDIPKALAAIVHQCLQKSPDARYNDAGEIAAQLRALGDHSSSRPSLDLTTISAKIPVMVGRRGQRLRALLVGAAIVAGAALAGYLWIPFGRNSGSTTPPVFSSAEALQRAQAYLQRYDRRGNVDRAISTLEGSIERDGRNPALQAALAETYVRKYTETSDKRWLRMAEDLGRRAVAANQDLAVSHIALGQALAANGQTAEATREFERARDLNPLSGPALLGLAALRPQPADAEQLYQKAVQYSPGDWIALNVLAAFYYREARYEDSDAKWREALQLSPDNTRVMVNLAGGLHMLGDYDLAADMLQRALTLDDSVASTWAILSSGG
jgi:serine/threonine protein kinase